MHWCFEALAITAQSPVSAYVLRPSNIIWQSCSSYLRRPSLHLFHTWRPWDFPMLLIEWNNATSCGWQVPIVVDSRIRILENGLVILWYKHLQGSVRLFQQIVSQSPMILKTIWVRLILKSYRTTAISR